MLNSSKLLPRLSIRVKLVIAFCLIGVVPVALVGGYGAAFSFTLLNQAVLGALQEDVSLKAGQIQQFLETSREDVLSLSRLPTVRALIEAPRQPPRAAVAPVKRAFLAVSESRKIYHQIGYLNQRGREVVRVDFDGERHQIIPAAGLQEKRTRYYFPEAMAVPAGVLYVPTDLSDERGNVASPSRLVIRYATRLVNSRGESRGIVIVHVDASKIVSQVVRLRRERGTVFLVDSRGVYLAHSDRVRPESGAFVASAGESLHRDFPEGVTAAVLSRRPGTMAEPGLRGRILAFAPIQLGPGREFWMLVHAYSKGEVLSSIRSLQVVVLVLGGGVLVIALGAGVTLARHFTRPITRLIRGAEAVAAGDFDRAIQVNTNDEFEDLSHQFNRMADRLKERERELLEARERAERKAREAEALYRIGTEISRLLSLPRILELVVEKARELLKSDVAILCLDEPGVGLRIGAASGLLEPLSLRPGKPVEATGSEEIGSPGALCPIPHSIGLAAHAAVRLQSGERVVGNLCVGYRTARRVDPDETEFLKGLASQAAVAIENARLHREVRSLAALEERARIGQDLHDGIIQSIYATGLGLEECLKLAEEDPQEVKLKLEAAIESLNTVIRDVRNYIVGLGPERLQDHDLSRALADLSKGLSLNALLDLDLSLEPGVDGTLTPEQAGHLLHICREALTNVVKHAGASRAVLTLGRIKGGLRLSVEDNGAGFDPTRLSASGQGLCNMGERARRLGGSLSIESAPGRGTRVSVEIPLEAAA
ncbi:MAG: HAMP domain-containing protein [Chloroflexi bacterium]|nr:HAMP domain-containing protein [Chloroflexota bacterium]